MFSALKNHLKVLYRGAYIYRVFQSFKALFETPCIYMYILTYLFHGAESFFRS